MAKINGRIVELTLETERVCGGQSISLNVDVDLPDATTQCGEGGWEEQIHGTRNWSADLSGLYDPDYDFNSDALIAAILNEDQLDIVIEVDDLGEFDSTCKVSSVSLTADMEAPLAFSFTVEGDDELTHTP